MTHCCVSVCVSAVTCMWEKETEGVRATHSRHMCVTVRECACVSVYVCVRVYVASACACVRDERKRDAERMDVPTLCVNPARHV